MKKGFDKEKHEAVGAYLKDTRKTLVALYLDICTSYGKNSREARQAGALLKRLETLRCTLDEHMIHHYPDASLQTYYG